MTAGLVSRKSRLYQERLYQESQDCLLILSWLGLQVAGDISSTSSEDEDEDEDNKSIDSVSSTSSEGGSPRASPPRHSIMISSRDKANAPSSGGES